MSAVLIHSGHSRGVDPKPWLAGTGYGSRWLPLGPGGVGPTHPPATARVFATLRCTMFCCRRRRRRLSLSLSVVAVERPRRERHVVAQHPRGMLRAACLRTGAIVVECMLLSGCVVVVCLFIIIGSYILIAGQQVLSGELFLGVFLVTYSRC